MSQVAPYYADSNQAAKARDISRALSRGTCGSVSVEIRRDNKNIKIGSERVEITKLDLTRTARNDLSGDTFQILAQNIAYLKLSSIKADRVGEYLRAAADTKGLIVDIRNYPSDFVVFALGSHLVRHEVQFVRFTSADLTNPGVFRWQQSPTLGPESPYYSRKVVILVDEDSQSHRNILRWPCEQRRMPS